jgi:hypothetical protein
MRHVLVAALPLLFASVSAHAATELNLSKDAATDPQATALIVTGKGTGNIFLGRASATLQFITDLSVPEAQRQPVKLSALFRDKFPRVSPGQYLVQVGCFQSGMVSFNQVFPVTIDAKPGKTYVVYCTGSRPVSRSAEVRETDQTTQ